MGLIYFTPFSSTSQARVTFMLKFFHLPSIWDCCQTEWRLEQANDDIREGNMKKYCRIFPEKVLKIWIKIESGEMLRVNNFFLSILLNFSKRYHAIKRSSCVVEFSRKRFILGISTWNLSCLRSICMIWYQFLWPEQTIMRWASI